MRATNMRTKLRRRRAQQIREGRAVSPVVATLILILVAVAAAAALYLWLVAWQGQVTGGIGTPTAQYTVTIGGSTSVYPFTQEAAKEFQQNNSNIVISVNQGGSGAGRLAVCSGAVDIGEASSYTTVATLI
ncbi:MAG TPA: substrate-binding domain-containing protein, partial [Thermoplasmata archaeon]|nr:substrate-binding domain-containing protein [Thermoplasmata archaeon]